MSHCERIANCPFFNDQMAEMPATASIYKRRYCKGDNSRCARLKVLEKAGPAAVPADLFPNQWERVEEILERTRGA